MNILVATISVLPRPDGNGKITQRKYNIKIQDTDTGPIYAVHTNESIIRAYASINVEIDKIIALCSDKVLGTKDANFDGLTAYEYYAKQADELFEGVALLPVPIDGRTNSQILGDICDEISPDDIVYLDIAGGQRTIANIIQLLTKILQYKGIKNPLSLYSDIQNANTIVDTQEFTVMTNIADAVNEFVTTGKSVQLNECLKSSPDFTDMLVAMNDFSEKIMLCNIGNLEETLSSLKTAINNLTGDQSVSSIQHTIIKQLIPIIQDKLFVNQDNINYKQIIKWCLDNGLIQQAATIYIEKMPVDYFRKGLLDNYVDLDNVTPKLGNTKETAGFYEDLFDMFAGNNTDDNLNEFQTFVKRTIDNKFERLQKEIIEKITKNQQYLSDVNKQACRRLTKFIKEQYNTKSQRKPAVLYTLNAPKELSGFLRNLTTTPEYHHYFVYQDPEKWNQIKDLKSLGTYEKKARALKKAKQRDSTLFALMAHYLAVKLLRNRMNHASFGEDWTDDETSAIQYLKSEGFIIQFSMAAIKKIISDGIELG